MSPSVSARRADIVRRYKSLSVVYSAVADTL